MSKHYTLNPFTDKFDAITSLSTLDGRYLKLDCSNDPLTGSLEIDGDLQLDGGDFNIGTGSLNVQDLLDQDFYFNIKPYMSGTNSAILNIYNANNGYLRIARTSSLAYIDDSAVPLCLQIDATNNVRVFNLAVEGRNPTFTVFGFPTGGALKYGWFGIADTTSDFHIGAENDLILVPTGGDVRVEAHLHVIDTKKLYLGTGADGELYSSSDDIYIRNVTQDKDIYIQVDDGGVTKTPFFVDSSEQKLGMWTTSPETAFHLNFDGGSVPEFPAEDRSRTFCISRTAAADRDVVFSLISGATAQASIAFGDTADENAGMIQYWHTTDSMGFRTATVENQMLLSSTSLTLANSISLNLQEDITFLGATTVNQIKFPDNLADALSFLEGANAYVTFVTTNGSEEVQIHKKLDVRTHKIEGVVDPTADQEAATKKYHDDNLPTVVPTKEFLHFGAIARIATSQFDYMINGIICVGGAIPQNTGYIMPRAGAITGISTVTTITAGAEGELARFEVYINGTATGFYNEFNEGIIATLADYDTQANTEDTFSAGDAILVYIYLTGPVTPPSVENSVTIVEVEYT